MSSERITQSRAAVAGWLRTRLAWGPEQATIGHVPHLSTPRFDLFIVAQRPRSGAGEFAVMSDGVEVLPTNRKHLARVLVAEGFPADPAALPAGQVAQLYLLMAEARRDRLIEHANDSALEHLPRAARAGFQPPRAEKDGDGAVVTFWSTARPGQAERWEIRVGANGSLTYSAESVEQG